MASVAEGKRDDPVHDEGAHSAEHHVDVAQAERAFHDLERRLSRMSQASIRHENREKDHQSANSTLAEKDEVDIEKGEAFDLREYLSSSADANQRAGIKHKHVGVTWNDLEVQVIGGLENKFYVRTFADAILSFFLYPFFFIWGLVRPLFPMKPMPTRTILHKNSGVLKPGEMCLVLGCPGAGCSTFLKTIANQRDGYASVTGDVRYAGMDAAEMSKYYKGEVVYNEEDDIHIATLTVAQTLSFALSLKTPGPNGRLPGVTGKQIRQETQDTLLKMLNISHTAQTLVGDEFVRGVSGGERKRVSLAEMMATRARVQCWDNSTRGLDASTALDFAKSLRVMTDVLGQTTFVSLYQAGEGIYDLFDKVLVLDKGQQVFYGNPTEARGYFENLGFKSLPRQSTADYLTGCTDANERQFAPGRSKNDTPSTPEALQGAFRSTSIYSENMSQLEKYKAHMEVEKADQEAFRQAVLDDKKRGVSKKSPYTQGTMSQIRALTVRQFQMRLQDTFQLYTSFGLATFLALIIGAAFINLPLTSSGAFTRGGVMFAGLLTICLDAFGEMPLMMLGRPIVRKQTGYSFYRPAATVLANTLADIPFSAVRVFLFNVIIYFMSGLHRSAGGFFTYHLFVYTAYLAMQGLFRTIGLLCTNFDSAFRAATFLIPNFIQYAGYTLQLGTMKRWLFWIYYINPLGYALSGILENEFGRISLTCDGNSVVPRNAPGMSLYPDNLGPNQACTLYGARAGSSEILGADYLSVGYQQNVHDLWRRNLPVIIGFVLLFQLTQVLVIEYYPQFIANISFKIFAKEDAETKKLNEELRLRKEERTRLAEERKDKQVDSNEITISEEKVHRQTFTWEQLNYHVPVQGGQKRLLHDVYGYVKPGTLTALMGASGAGKTTCLDVLAQRKTIGVVSGDVLVDGRPLGSDFARGTAYAEQMDVHEGTATVREALRFSAYLRQPASVPESEKNAYVEEMLELLEMQDYAEALVFSLDVEARKRLTIGVELASKPELLLFLDEPTSGLDAQSAWNLVRFLRKLANQGQAILCTIHQPSSLLFESFDRLLLLERGGETVYFGDIGEDSRVLRDYFARHGALCPANVNPAEFMLDAIGAGTSARIGDQDWKDIWLDSPEYQAVRAEITSIKNSAPSPATGGGKTPTYATSFLYQLKVVVQRNNLALSRSPDYVFTRLFVHAFISLWISLSFLNLGDSARDLQYRVFGIFWSTILPAIVMAQLQPMFIMNRRIFIREASSRIYSPQVFAIGQLVGEIPYSILCAVVYWVLMVYPMGFGNGAFGTNGTGFQFLVILFLELFGVTFGQFLAAISPSIQVTVLFNPVFAVILTTFCGVTLPYPTLNSFWHWVYEASPYTRSLAAMVSTELHGLAIRCQPEEFAIFDPPSGQTCAAWAGDFVKTFGGYIDNLSDTAACRYCQYAVGDEFFVPLRMSVSNRWRDAFILFSFFVFNMIVTIIASRYLRYAKR